MAPRAKIAASHRLLIPRPSPSPNSLSCLDVPICGAGVGNDDLPDVKTSLGLNAEDVGSRGGGLLNHADSENGTTGRSSLA